MKRISRKITSWNRFRTRNFAVKSELLGLFHEFKFHKLQVRIDLPGRDALPKKGDESNRLALVTSTDVNGKQVPLEYEVHDVDVRVFFPNEIRLPEAVLDKNPNAYELFKENEQKGLDKVTEKYGEVAEQAFDLWVRTVRWKCRNSRFARPDISGHYAGFGTRLEDVDRKKCIWIAPIKFVALGHCLVTPEKWAELQIALKASAEPPVYYDLLFDGVEHMKIGDLGRAAVDLAVACESFLRVLVMKSLPKDFANGFKGYINEANIRQVLDRFTPAIFTNEEYDSFMKIRKTLDRLFDIRNDILHSGRAETLTHEECEKFMRITEKLLALRSDL